MEIKLTVRAEIIAVLKLFAATDDIRYFLTGINLEIGKTEARLVATDGHMLGCFRVETEQPGIDAPIDNIIIPGELLKCVKKRGSVDIVIGKPDTPESIVRPVCVTYKNTITKGVTIDAMYPIYRSAVPAIVSGQIAQFDPRLIATIGKAWRILHGKHTYSRVSIGHNGESGALIDLCDNDFIGVIMPLKPDSVTAPAAPPDWWNADAA